MSTLTRVITPPLPCAAQLALEYAGEFCPVTVLKEHKRDFLVRLEEAALVAGKVRPAGTEYKAGKGDVVFPGQKPPWKPRYEAVGIREEAAGFAEFITDNE